MDRLVGILSYGLTGLTTVWSVIGKQFMHSTSYIRATLGIPSLAKNTQINFKISPLLKIFPPIRWVLLIDISEAIAQSSAPIAQRPEYVITW